MAASSDPEKPPLPPAATSSNGGSTTNSASTIRVEDNKNSEIRPDQLQPPQALASLSKEEEGGDYGIRASSSSSSSSSSGPAASPTAAAPAAAPDSTPESSRTKAQTTLIISALASALFLAALDVTIVTVAIPTIAQEFSSTAGYTWIGSAYMLASASGAPMWGKVSDIWGRKQVMLIAVAVFWVGSLLSGLSRNMGMLIAARAIQGVGGGGVIILVNVCISDLFSMRKRGVYFGVMGIVWAIASAIGPVLGGVFTSRVTWRWCFYINLPISGVGFAVLAFVLKLHNPRTPMRQGLAAVDWLGSLTVIGATLMVLFGLEFGGVSYPWTSPTVLCLIIFGAVAAGVFVLIEWKVAKYPLMPLRLFKRRASIASLGVAAFQAIVFISGSYYLPLYFQSVLGASPLMSGIYILPFVLSLSVVSAITGAIIKKTGRYLECIVAGMAIMTIGFGLFINLEPKANWAKIIIYQIIAGVGVGPNFQAPLIALQSTVERRDMAAATATFGFVRQLFTSISVVIGGVVFQNSMQDQYPRLLAELGPEAADLLSGHNAASSVGLVQELPEQDQDVARQAYYKSIRTMYIMYVAFAAVGTLVSLLVGSRTLSKDHEEHKTGLQSMEAEAAARRSSNPAAVNTDTATDEEKGQVDQPSGKKAKTKFFFEKH